jgi:nucleoside triphosphate pyrophosphatase
MAPPRIILASASEIRAKMLRNTGVRFTVERARIDEDALKAALLAEHVKPRYVADHLAEMKALRLSRKFPDAIIIGSDQVLAFDGQLLSKAKDRSELRAQLKSLRGNSHHLYSAAVVVQNGQPLWRYVGQTRLWMRGFTDQYLDAYLAAEGDDLLHCVGGYKLESKGIRLFEKIEGDYFNVLGMPLLELLNHLATIGSIET